MLPATRPSSPASIPDMQRIHPFVWALVLAGGMTTATAGFSLSDHPIPVEGEGLTRSVVFARIDSLEAVYHEAEGRARADLAMRLGQLYLAVDLPEHRRTALDLLEEAFREGSDPFGAARLRAATAHRMRYTGDASGWIERLCAAHPDDARAHALMGRFHFLEGRRRMITPRFERARDAFARAVRADSTGTDGWYGLSASALALGQYGLAADAARVLGRLDPDDPRSLFLEGAAQQGAGNEEAAARAFAEGLDRAGDDLRAVFEGASGFLDETDLVRVAERSFPRQWGQEALQRLGEDPRLGEEVDWQLALTDSTLRAEAVAVYWNSQNDRPAQIYNPQRLRYWARLVEADVLFGDPEAGRRGWETSMGDALVRWGRPSHTYYDTGSGSTVLNELSARGFPLPVGTQIRAGDPLWVWGYLQEGMGFSLIFQDLSRNARWTYGSRTAEVALRLRRQQPLLLPPAPTRPTPFRLAVSRAIFPRGDDEAVLETYIGLRPNEEMVLDAATARGDTLATVEWALYDAADNRIDYRRESVHDVMRRDGIHDRLGWPSTPDLLDPYVIPIGARLPAGRYRIAVEATGPPGTGRDALTIEVEVPPTEPPSILEMSDLQVATAYGAYTPDSGVPLRYVKFGQTVVPAPDLRVPETSEAMAVYFELRHLGLDETGRTHFDVTYEVFESNREVRNLTLASTDFDRDDLRRIEPMTMTFLEERTGMSGEGVVVKGTRLDIVDLRAGDYVLVVTVRDRISAREVSRFVPFRKRGR